MPAASTTEKAAGIAFDRFGSGDPLLLIHGTGGSRAHWQPLLGLLQGHRELIVLDLPGHGDSDPPPPGSAHTPSTYATRLAELLDQLGLETAHAVGNSVGGWTALELAKLGRARSVVAVSPAGLWPGRDPRRATLSLWAQRKLGRLLAPIVPAMLRSETGRTLIMSGTVAKPRDLPADAAINMFQAYIRTPTFDVHLKQTRRERFEGGQTIKVPTTIVWGGKERLLPPRARRTDELPAHAEVLTLPDCGHVPMWDNPRALASVILKGTTATRTHAQ